MLEYPEELVRILHVKAGAVIFDEIHEFPRRSSFPMADLDAGHFPSPGEFERVRDEIEEDLSEHGRIGSADRQVADRHGDAAPLLRTTELVERLLNQASRRDGLKVYGLT